MVASSAQSRGQQLLRLREIFASLAIEQFAHNFWKFSFSQTSCPPGKTVAMPRAFEVCCEPKMENGPDTADPHIDVDMQPQ